MSPNRLIRFSQEKQGSKDDWYTESSISYNYSFIRLPRNVCAQLVQMGCAPDTMEPVLGISIPDSGWRWGDEYEVRVRLASDYQDGFYMHDTSPTEPAINSVHESSRLKELMSDTTTIPRSNARSCTRPLGMMLQGCLAWYRRQRSRSEKEKKRPCSDSTLVPNNEVDEFSMKMGSIPIDGPGHRQCQPTPPQPAAAASQITEPQRFCKYSSEFDRRKWGELQPQVVPTDMVLKRVKLSTLDSSSLHGSLVVAAHG
ncbi:hypothetical protein IF2G_05627 [Cordyceps javanica]|nr:hypothetical protein IF2G_05627 [Cordyceps javanica]